LQPEPGATHLYSCDYRWWKHHIGDVSQEFEGTCWTQDKQWNDTGCTPAAQWGIKQLVSEGKPGLSKKPGIIHQGRNSGYQALNLAGHLLNWDGRVILIGYDMQSRNGQRHWFGAHPSGLEVASNYGDFIQAFETIKPSEYGLEILNATRQTALQAFPVVDLDELCAALS